MIGTSVSAIFLNKLPFIEKLLSELKERTFECLRVDRQFILILIILTDQIISVQNNNLCATY